MKKEFFRQIKQILPRIQKNIPLKNYTTFRIGGPAEYFLKAKTKEDLIEGISAAQKKGLPFFILGKGSNLLVSDKGYRGLIINFQFSPALSQKGGVQKDKIVAGAGTELKELVNVSAKKGLTGLEWAAGIPGTVGGAVYGNAGAFGKSIKDVVKSAEVFDVKTGKIEIFKNKPRTFSHQKMRDKDCQFGYRSSIFKNKKNLIILSVQIQLKKGKKKEIKEKIREYLEYRKKKHPLNFPSAGSIFMNCESGITNYELIKKFPELKEFKKRGEVPAGWLIEKCGLKGKKIGEVKISEKHTNFIVNLGKGKAKDVKKLINLAKKKVKNKFKVELKEEIQYLGF